MDIETRKSFNKLKHYLTLFNNAYFDKEHMWILYEIPVKPKLHCLYIENSWVESKTILSMDYLQWI